MLSDKHKKHESLIVREVSVDPTKIHRHTFPSEFGLIIDPVEESLIFNSIIYSKTHKWLFIQKDSSITMQIENFLNWLIDQNIKLHQPNDLRSYLLQHSDILRFLPLVCKIVIHTFSPPHQLSLEVYHDDEIHDEYLTLYVRTTSYDETLLKAIATLGEEYQPYLGDSTGWFLVTTDFQPPQ